jgi:hypothetical protein
MWESAVPRICSLPIVSAAADTASEAFRERHFAGTDRRVAAAVFGPTLAQLSRELFPAYIFAGCYGVMIFLYAGIIALLPKTRIRRCPTRRGATVAARWRRSCGRRRSRSRFSRA